MNERPEPALRTPPGPPVVKQRMANDHAAVLHLLTHARAVLFDFDGPVCDLFRGVSTAGVAEQVKRAARQRWGNLDLDVEECHDSHGILQQLRTMYDRTDPQPCRRPLDLAERIVTRQERAAVATAAQAPEIVTLVDLLLELRMRLVVVSNNAERPIRVHLNQRELKGKFEKICGRDPKNARLMKPHPDCIDRALRHLSLPGSQCILIGDQLTDLKAAAAAGTAFIGYTREPSRARQMTHDGADAVVASYAPVIEAARELLKYGEESGRVLSPVIG